MAIGTPADIGNNATTGTAALTLSITLASGVAAGALILVSIANHNSAAVVPDSVTDTAGNTYTLITAANASAVTATLAYCVNASALSAGNTITVTFSSTRHIAMRAYSVSGIAASSAFDVSATQAAGSGTSASVGPTSTTTQADELVFASWAYQNSRTFTPGTGYTAGTKDETTSTIRGRVAEWKIVSATGAQTADGTWSASTTHAGVVATFKADASSLKSGSDTGTATDASSLSASATKTDSATASESAVAQNIGTAVSGSDTASTTDASSLAAAASTADTATAADTGSLAAAAASTDTATAADSAQITPGGRNDSATVSDASSLAVTTTKTDSATFTESANVTLLIVQYPSALLTHIVPAEVRSASPSALLTDIVPAEVRA